MRHLAAITLSVLLIAPAMAQDMDRTATAVFAAAGEGNVSQLRDYLDGGYDVNYQRKGDTALSVAVVFKRPEAVRFLLDRGANAAMLTYEEYVIGQQTPRPLIEYARRSSSPEIVALLEAHLRKPPLADVVALAQVPASVSASVRASSATAPRATDLLSRFMQTVRADPVLLLAARQTQRGAAASSIPSLLSYTRANPRNAEAWYLLSMAYADTNQKHLATAAINRAASLNPELNELSRYLGEQRTASGGNSTPQPSAGHVQERTAAVPQAASNTAVTGQREWPEAGSIASGERVLMSTSGGERWKPGVLTEIGAGDLAGSVKAMENPDDSWSGSWLDPSRVVRPTREPFWTGFFVGDWQVNTGGAVNYRSDGREVYQVVTGGEKLPPLRIHADGTYKWREADSQGKIVTGRWKPREDAPGIVILSGPRGVDWTLWNTTTVSTRQTYKRDQIRVHGPVYSWEALRLSR